MIGLPVTRTAAAALAPYAALALAVLLAAAGAWHFNAVHAAEAAGVKSGRAEVQAKWDAEKVRVQAVALVEQERAAAEREHQRAAQQENDRANRKLVEQLRADVASGDAAAERLRQRTAAAIAAARGGGQAAAAAAPVGEREAAAGTADLLAIVQRRLVEAAGRIAAVADERGAAGLKCQADYSALTPQPPDRED